MKILLSLAICAITIDAFALENCFKFDMNRNRIDDYLCSNPVVNIPETINGKPVLRIGYKAFSNKNLESVTLPSTLIEIDHQAFMENKLTDIVLPDNLLYLGFHAFQSNEIETLALGTNLKMISHAAFMYNKIKTIRFPDSLEVIGKLAFSNNKLIALTFPEHSSLSQIGERAFERNEIKGDVVFPERLEVISAKAFSFNQIDTISVTGTTSYIHRMAFFNNNLKTVLLNPSVRYIESSAFSGQRSKLLNAVCLGEKVLIEKIVKPTTLDEHFQEFTSYYTDNGSLSGCYYFVDDSWTFKY